MFWRKKNTTPQSSAPAVAVATIPQEFYAGRTPEVVFETAPKTNKVKSVPAAPALTPANKKAMDKATTVGADNPSHPALALSNKRTFLLILCVVFVLGVIGGVVYYFILKRTNPVQPLPPVPTVTTPETAVTEPESTAPTVTTTPTMPESPVPATAAPFTTVSAAIGLSADGDSDGLTDTEEDLFKTDPSLADSDKDNYQDSHEVYNLYNPTGKEPMKLSESGLVNTYTNPAYGFSLYTPVSWATGNVDPESKDVLFSTFTGEYVRVKVFTKDQNETADQFVIRVLPGENFSSYQTFSSVFKESAYRRKDFMVFVFLHSDIGVVIAYETPPESAFINYPTVVKMMARSFKFENNKNSVPLPAAESPTSTPSGL